MSSNASGPTLCTLVATQRYQTLGNKANRRVVDHRRSAVGRKMVRAHDPLAEIRLDLRHQFLGITRFGYLLDLVHAQAMPVLVESLALAEPQQSFPVDDQAAVSAADGIDQDRVLSMRHPCRAQQIGRASCRERV